MANPPSTQPTLSVSGTGYPVTVSGSTSTGPQLTPPVADMTLTGVPPTSSFFVNIITLTPPSASLQLQTTIPSTILFSYIIPLSPPSANMSLTGAAPAIGMQASAPATRWATMGGKFRLAIDGREVPFKTFT